MKLFKNVSLFILIFHNFNFDKCYLFSVIMAIYNTGRYLDDSINSLVNQTINFKTNIQVILVNDGSIDDSENICLKYQSIYSDNIKYIKIDHEGVSKARNIGLKYAEGKYINFLDPDDIWHYNAFNLVYLFFKFNKNINLAAGRLKFFEASEKYHPLDYKFYKTRVANLSEEYNCIQQSVSSAFFRKSLIKGKKFDEQAFSGEDTIFINNILLLNPVMGLIREAIYLYRRRADSSSTVQNQKYNLNFYSKTIEQVENYLINTSIFLYNEILPFIQFFVGYDILFRIKANINLVLDNNSLYGYISIIKELLNKIEDKYILEQRNVPNNYKIYLLSRKHQKDLRYEMFINNNIFYYINYIMINLNQNSIVFWRILDIKNNILYLEGKDNFWMPSKNYYYYCKLNDKIFYPNYIEYSNYDQYTIYGIIHKGKIIMYEIPLNQINNIQILSFFMDYLGINFEILTSLGWYSHIPPISNGYYISNNYIIKFIQNRFIIYKYNKALEKKFENQYCDELRRMKKNYLIKFRKKSKIYIDNIKNTKKKEIWIINDRRDQAGDNGEYFYRYLKNKNPEDIKIYFAIEKNCTDFQRLKKLGNILDLNSQKYLNIFIIADKIISSISNGWVVNPFKSDYIYLRDLLKFENIFLQHGIIKDDLSNYLNKYNKKYDYFVTSSKKEYKSLLKYKYGYNKNNIILSGLPRYDNLERLKNKINKEKKIVIIPTWRVNIKGTIDLQTYKSIHSETFKFTSFFKFYNKMINDEKLLLYMKKYNYKGIFCLHPCFSAQWIDFNYNEIFSIKKKCNYQKYLLKGSLLITDYSSIFFDFGYLKKPIIYSHFDYKEYRNFHYREGYFDYRLDGFGPVCQDINCTVNEIIYEIENNCVLRAKYLKRIEKFFGFFDQNNSERVFREITKQNKKIKTKSMKAIFVIFILIIFEKFIKNNFFEMNKNS